MGSASSVDPMLTEEELAESVLNFLKTSFAFERLLKLEGTEFAVFTRRETEAEAKLRPKVIRRWVVVPHTWVFFDKDADVLVLGKGGHKPSRLIALQVEGERSTLPADHFQEQGIEFMTHRFPGDLELYAPRPFATEWTPLTYAALGLPPPTVRPSPH